ncbi:TetR/AcrR family transcriptional regulator [Nocardiopsis kunsanensis]|uniref:TetR/AcrR family transcriptional regulator n=1 Tax=Nocardiopsis kunsanensis TaxID=141693 RepID=UPI0003734E89|nr:TetR/AcrR family transcriptional regulator [Nocardiopsis kunsanensis]
MVQSARSRRSPQARAERADRILDAAADLMVVLGPGKTTIEDVARRAGVGKGTVYLHFPTKEVLFLVVLMRAQSGVTARIMERMKADPVETLPSRVGVSALEGLANSPLLREVYMNNAGMIDTITETALSESGDLIDQRIHDFETYFQLLREHGLVRTDLSSDELFHIFGTTLTGFLVHPPLLEHQERRVPGQERRTRLAADALHRSLGENEDPDTLRAAWPRVVAVFDHTDQQVRAEIDRYRTVRRE